MEPKSNPTKIHFCSHLLLAFSALAATNTLLVLWAIVLRSASTGRLGAMFSLMSIVYTSVLYTSSHGMATIAATATLSVALPARAEKEIATAGTGNPTLTTGDAPDSICPYGWRLPRKDEQYDNLFQTFLNRLAYNSGTPTVLSPLNSAYTGYLSPYFREPRSQNTSCNYWTTTQNRSQAYYLSLTQSQLVYDLNGKDVGNSLRCLAR